jgi:hypothetical protein
MKTLKEIIPEGMSETLFYDNCYLDFKFFGERVFGLDMQPFHVRMLEKIYKSKRLVVKAARGLGKSTILALIYPLWLCIFHPGSHILFTAASQKQAERLLSILKDEIEDNEFFSELKPNNPSRWGAGWVKMSNGCEIFCKAFTKGIKGVHVDYCFVDEIQDIEDRRNYKDAVVPTTNKKKGSIAVVGTDNDPTDMLNELYENPEYEKLFYPILIAEGVSIWPSVFSIEYIQQIRRDIGEASFQRQYMLNPKAAMEEAVFSPDWIGNCYDNTLCFTAGKMHETGVVVIGADFAISKAKHADYDAYVVLEKFGGKVYLRYAERHKGLPKAAKQERLKSLYHQYNATKLILDPANVGEAILQDLRMESYNVEAGEFHSSARNKLLVNLLMMIQPDENSEESVLVIPRDSEDPACLTFTNTLTQELISFREVKSPTSGMKSFQSKGAHDDCAIALALACKATNDVQDFSDFMAF